MPIREDSSARASRTGRDSRAARHRAQAEDDREQRQELRLKTQHAVGSPVDSIAVSLTPYSVSGRLNRCERVSPSLGQSQPMHCRWGPDQLQLRWFRAHSRERTDAVRMT
jgi:hypothetical protein